MALDLLFTETDLRNRLGTQVVDRIYDDLGEGEADTDVVAALITDASASVLASLPDDFVFASATVQKQAYLKKLALDYAQANAYLRIPSMNLTEVGSALLSTTQKAITTYGTQLIKYSEAATEQGGGAVVSGGTTTSAGSVASGESVFVSGSANPWLR